MALTTSIKGWYLKKLPGMNNKVEDLDLKSKWVEQAQNCRFEGTPGAVSKRARLAYYNSSAMDSSEPVVGAYRYYQSDGTIKLISVCDTVAYVGTDSSGTMTSIRTGLTSGKRCSFKVYKDLLYVSNGYDNVWVYDGTSDNVTWEMGACKAVLASGGSNLDSAADYSYKITIDDDAYICGAVSNTVTTDASNRKVTLSNIPLGPAGSANRKIYRTEGDGSTYKLLDTIADNTTTTYTDDIADGSLGVNMGAVTDDIPVGSLLQLHRERLFVSGDPDNPSRIYYSNPYLPHYIQQTTNTDYMDVSEDDNDEIMGIPIQLGVMCCIKKNTIRKLHITTPVSGSDPSTWYADDPISFNGSPAMWSIVQTPLGIAYLGWDHWYIFDGAASRPIIDEFDTGDVLGTSYSDIVAHWQKGVLLAAYTDSESGSQIHDRVMRYNFKRKTLSYDTGNVNCFCSFSGDDERGDVYYGSSEAGYIYMGERSPFWVSYKKKSELDDYYDKNDMVVRGEEDDPWIAVGRDETIDELTGTIDDLTGTVDQDITYGNYTFKAVNVNASSLGEIYWNLDRYNDSDTCYIYTRTGSSQTTVEEGSSCTVTNADDKFTAADHGLTNGDRVEITATTLPTGVTAGKVYYVVGVSGSDFQISTSSGGSAVSLSDDGTSVYFKEWSAALSDPNGEDIASTVDDWIQVKIEMTANSMAGSPKIYFTNGYLLRFDYYRGSSTMAETDVEFIYRFGFRNFDAPMLDKIFKKITSIHDGDSGNVTLEWETEYANGSFIFALENYPNRWESFFPSNAFGRKIDFTIYKNDANDFTLKELQGAYSPQPNII